VAGTLAPLANGPASALLTLACLIQKLLLWMPGTVAVAACRSIPRKTRGTALAADPVLRAPSRLADLEDRRSQPGKHVMRTGSGQ
jgi:hypothetical protein